MLRGIDPIIRYSLYLWIIAVFMLIDISLIGMVHTKVASDRFASALAEDRSSALYGKSDILYNSSKGTLVVSDTKSPPLQCVKGCLVRDRSKMDFWLWLTDLMLTSPSCMSCR